MEKQVENRLLSSSELFALAGRKTFVEESLEILTESVRDRIAGYPTMPGWETGKFVPFEADTTDTGGSKKRMYPLNQPPVPLDFQISRDIEVDGIDNPFLDSRLKDYPTAISSTKTAHYRIPGMFYNEASAPPRNITMELLKDDGIYQSTGDLAVFLKSIYEEFPELLTVEINFFNGGAGTTLQFPATAVNDQTFTDSYVTKGCDWMASTKNPYTGKPYAKEAKCPPSGTEVPSRLFNPMENRHIAGTILYTTMQFEKHSNLGVDATGGTESNGNATKTTTATTTPVPPTRSQKAKRDKVIDHLVNWEGPRISTKDNKSLVLLASKAIYDRM